ncbi:MAG: L-serine ammonia-lyase, iron-sulfur-dependent, subunit alpha [Pseudomonadota bacterium]
MDITEYLAKEWVPALGCTEPASIALAAATAAGKLEGSLVSISLTCDPRIYKNCYAVGIPHSEHRTGILWALAIGAYLPSTSPGLQCFGQVTPEIINKAQKLIDEKRISVEVDVEKNELFIDCIVKGMSGSARTVIEQDHTNIVLIEKDEEVLFEKERSTEHEKMDARRLVAQMPLYDMIDMAKGISSDDRQRLSEGIEMNLSIAEHGLTLFPKRFVELTSRDMLSRISAYVCAAVYARMWGEEYPVMTLAGSGNKGITASLPLAMWGESKGIPKRVVEEALALACLVTSATTHHLGTLSAVCGCSNAAGIGLSAGLVLLENGGTEQISLAINNMVGNVSGMICDGAKIGCALKTMTAVDAAFRSSSLAMSGVGIPPCDGIVGENGVASLKNLGRISTRGMTSMDREILAIMKEKLIQ